jgi:hypothetical protein
LSVRLTMDFPLFVSVPTTDTSLSFLLCDARFKQK